VIGSKPSTQSLSPNTGSSQGMKQLQTPSSVLSSSKTVHSKCV